MKKIIGTALIVLVFLAPSITRAQVVDQSALDSLRTQLVALLQQYVQNLVDQLEELRANQDRIEEEVAENKREITESKRTVAVQSPAVQAPINDTVVTITRLPTPENPETDFGIPRLYLDIRMTGSYDCDLFRIWSPTGHLSLNGAGFCTDDSNNRYYQAVFTHQKGTWKWLADVKANPVKQVFEGTFEVE